MSDSKQRDAAESLFARNQRRETEIDGALMQEAARHAAVIKNMHRLKALRLAPDTKHGSAASSRSLAPVKKPKKA
jgi:hypothetical protein